MERPPDLIDREEEWGRLVSLWGRDRPELAVVLGRRRVGKSFLLTRFSEEAGGIYRRSQDRATETPARSLRGSTGTPTHPDMFLP